MKKNYKTDLTGQAFGKLTAISYSHSDRHWRPYWKCRCECGTEKAIAARHLVGGKIKTCGCSGRSSTPIVFLTGKTFGRLTVISEAERRVNSHHAVRRWNCLCECGTNVTVDQPNLTSGTTTSCGCRLREIQANISQHTRRVHGHAGTPMYTIWHNMMSRCYDENNVRYKDYGGRGIKVCERWHDVQNFIADMGERPTGLTLERRENDKDYSCENCTWATPTVQARNRRITLLVTFRGEEKPLAELCETHGKPYKVVHDRLFRYNWDIEKALTTPIMANQYAFKKQPA